jgi:hypothetical protein
MAESRPFNWSGVSPGPGQSAGLLRARSAKLERGMLRDRCNPPERKITLRSGEDGEFSNNQQ